MSKVIDELKVIMEGYFEDDTDFDKPFKTDAPMPGPDEVLYVEPGPGRKCRNCVMWVKNNSCSIHKPDIEISEGMVCGYWVGGEPMREPPQHSALQAVNPKYSGLMMAPKEGTTCDNCSYYQPGSDQSGTCHAVHVEGKPAPVHPKACCSRWTNQG